MLFFNTFFQYFGFFAFIGIIILSFLIKKELKKQMPTEIEKVEMIKKGLITGKEKKRIIREKTLSYRYQKKFQEELKKALLKQTKTKQNGGV